MKNKKIIYLVVFLIKNYYLIDYIVIIVFVIFFINLFYDIFRKLCIYILK